jgi:O-antigen ligase
VIFSQHIGEAIIFFFNLLQALFLFWACYNLMRHEAIAKRALLTFALSAAALAGMLVLGIGTTVYESTSEGSRVTVLGQDPNTVAANMALSIMALLGLAFGSRISAVRYLFILWPLVVLLCVSLVLTGSRGGVLALGVGLLATALRQGPLRVIARNFIVGSLLIACAGWVIVNTEPMKSRYEKSVKRGNMSGREHIFPNAWAMFQEKPVLGWGPVNEQYELAIRTRDFEFGDPTKNADRKTRASHNLVLEVLTSTGLAGAIPLFACIGLCVGAGWKARRSSQGVVPFTLVMVALTINMTVPLQAAKQFWLILAYALAYGSYSLSRKKRRLVAVPDARQRVPSRRDASEALIGQSPGQ